MMCAVRSASGAGDGKLMSATTLHIFVSSTWLDLQPERKAVESAMQRLREAKLVGMEYFGSRGETTRTASLSEVDRSQLYVGIIGGRYGSGITEDEYHRARERHLDCLIYFKDESGITEHGRDIEHERLRRLEAFKDTLRRNHGVTFFTDPNDLAAKVTADLHRVIVEKCLPRRSSLTLFQAPPLPAYFVPRRTEFRDFKTRLLSEKSSGPVVISTIHGLGGIGKSTLAAAVARDPETLERFSDGVLWVTLGQKPDVLSLLGGWVQAMGDYNFKCLSVEATCSHLRTLNYFKSTLIVIGDAWDPSDVEPFLIHGARSRILITSRDAAIAKALRADLYDLNVMTSDEVLALLAGRLRRELKGSDRDQAMAVAKAVGYLPLALELVAAQVVDGISWGKLMEDLNAEVARLETLEIPGSEEVREDSIRKRLSLLASFNLSLRLLSPRRRSDFAWLGVLPIGEATSRGWGSCPSMSS